MVDKNTRPSKNSRRGEGGLNTAALSTETNNALQHPSAAGPRNKRSIQIPVPHTTRSLQGCMVSRPGLYLITYHFQSPDSADPHFQLPFNALDAFELHAFPPAPSLLLVSKGNKQGGGRGGYRRFPPEEQELLRHAKDAAVLVLGDLQPCQRKTANHGFVWFPGPVAPGIVGIEPTNSLSTATPQKGRKKPRTQPSASGSDVAP